MAKRERKGNNRKRAAADRRHFTETNVLSIRPRNKDRTKQHMVWDWGTDAARGLGILVSPSGTKSYRVTYYYPGSAKPYSMHLGRVGEMSLEEARQQTREARARARRGEDPAAGSTVKSGSFQSAVEDYIKHEQIGRRGNRSAASTRRVLLNNCRDWHHRPIGTIRSQEIEKLLWSVRDGDDDKGLRPRPYLSNRLYAHMRALFAWCARRKLIKASPVGDVDRPWEGAQPRNRAWFKKDAADNVIRSVWDVANRIGGAEGQYLKLMVLTGKRRRALADMRWDDIERDWFWDAPPSGVVNKRLEGIPLPDLAQRILSPRKSQGLVFGPINVERLLVRVKKMLGMPDFIFHGLRHIAETKTAELRVPPHIRDLLFDHKPVRGTGKDYDHSDPRPEMREALEAWANYVEGLVSAEGVALLR